MASGAFAVSFQGPGYVSNPFHSEKKCNVDPLPVSSYSDVFFRRWTDLKKFHSLAVCLEIKEISPTFQKKTSFLKIFSNLPYFCFNNVHLTIRNNVGDKSPTFSYHFRVLQATSTAARRNVSGSGPFGGAGA